MWHCLSDSVTYGLRKLRTYEKYHESNRWRDNILWSLVMKMWIEYMELCGKLGKKANLLDQFRETMYTIPKYIPISCMPPTSRAFWFHVLGAHLEVNICKNLEQSLEEKDHGFKTNVTEQLIPKITGTPPALSYLLQDMKCGCEKRIEQAFYVLDVVALKLGLHVVCYTNMMGVVKTTALRRNLLCQCCYSWEVLILFWSDIGSWGNISLLYPCYILLI